MVQVPSTSSARRTGVLLVLLLVLGLGFSLVGALAADAVEVSVTDDAGPDDEPGQKDLNSLVFDLDPATAGTVDVSWNWDYDQTDLSGGNTLDACSLIDTDEDGNANFSVCVIWGDDGDDSNGTDNDYITTRLYSCGDGAADKCDQPRSLLAQDDNGDGDLADAGEAISGGPYDSTCSVTFGQPDPFGARTGAQASDTTDAQASCQIVLVDFASTAAFLINVCSYPSQVPGSDPSDCVFAPNRGFLTIVKVADPDDDTVEFTFTLPPAATFIEGKGPDPDVQGPFEFVISGSGTEPSIAVNEGSWDLTEVVPPAWQLDSASCAIGEDPTGTLVGTAVESVTIETGKETVCTFTNSVALLPPDLTVVKTAGDAADGAIHQMSEPGGEVTFTVEITNNGGEATIDAFGDDIYPLAECLDGTDDDVVGQTIGENETITCTFTGSFTGNAGDSQTDIVTVAASNATGDDEATDDAVVEITDVVGVPLSVVKSVTSVSSLPEPGGDFDFEVMVTNESDVDTATVTDLDDSFLLDVQDNGLCSDEDGDTTAPFVLSPGEVLTCAFTVPHIGQPGSFDNVVSVVATDDDGQDVGGDSNQVTVKITDILPVISVDKSVDKTEVRAPGDTVVFTVVITNDSMAEAVEVTSLSDDIHTTAVCRDGGGLDVVGQSIAPEASLTCSFSAFVDADETDTVTVVVTDDDGNEATGDDRATVNLLVSELTVTKTADVGFVSAAGDEIIFTIEVANGGDTTELIVLSDVLSGGGIADPGLDLMAGPPFTDQGFTTPVADPGAGLAPGDTWYYRVAYTVSPADIDSRQSLTNEACVPDVDGDGEDECDTAIVEIQVAELTIVKETIDDNGGGYMVGDPITWTYLVTNTGTVTISDIVVTDDDPSVIVSCPTAVLDPGDDMTCSAAGTAVFGPYTNIGTVTGEGPNGGPDPEVADDNSGYNGEYWAFTPGFWKNHAKGKRSLWTGSISCASTGPITTSVTVGSVIAVPADYTVRTTQGKGRRSKVVETPIRDLTLLQALSLRGGSGIDGAAETLLRAATASLLNTCFHETLRNDIGDAGDVWPITLVELVERVEGALGSRERAEILTLASLLDSWNNGIDDIDWKDPLLFP